MFLTRNVPGQAVIATIDTKAFLLPPLLPQKDGGMMADRADPLSLLDI